MGGCFFFLVPEIIVKTNINRWNETNVDSGLIMTTGANSSRESGFMYIEHALFCNVLEWRFYPFDYPRETISSYRYYLEAPDSVITPAYNFLKF